MEKGLPRGLLVAIEGVDGSGKSTLASTLASELRTRGRRVVVTSEPWEQIGSGLLIRQILGGAEQGGRALALLFAANRAEHVEKLILPEIERGSIVVCDRYLMSTMAYQGIRYGRRWLLELAEGCPRPDLTVLLTLDAEVARCRMTGDRHYAAALHHIDTAYRREAELARMAGERVACIEASHAPEVVLDATLKMVEALIESTRVDAAAR